MVMTLPKMPPPAAARKGRRWRPPSLDVPEPATLIGDYSGTPYLRAGDSPAGRETLTVTPPGSAPVAARSARMGPTNSGANIYEQRVKEAAQRAQQMGGTLHVWEDGSGGIYPPGSHKSLWNTTDAGHNGQNYFVPTNGWSPELKTQISRWIAEAGQSAQPQSMAGGGSAVVGLAGDIAGNDPLLQYKRQLQRAQQNLGRTISLQQADQSGDAGVVGMANTLQNTRSKRYGQLGVSAPTRVKTSALGGLGPSPLVGEDVQTQGELLRDQYANQDQATQAAQDLQDAQAGLMSATLRKNRGSTMAAGNPDVTGASPSGGGGRGGGMGPTDNPMIPQEYIDPETGTRQLLNQHQIALAKADYGNRLKTQTGALKSTQDAALAQEQEKMDLERMSNERFGKQDELGALDDNEILNYVTKGTLQPGTAIRVLTRRGIPESQAIVKVRANLPASILKPKADKAVPIRDLQDAFDAGQITPEQYAGELSRQNFPDWYVRQQLSTALYDKVDSGDLGEEDFLTQMQKTGLTRQQAQDLLDQLDEANSGGAPSATKTPPTPAFTGTGGKLR